MEGLIPVVNKLQDVFNTLGQGKPPLDLPQIVVVGSQSSGKSSVLENVVGRGFLPRGAGICTRRPLVLQLQHVNGEDEWAEFLHLPNRKLTDFEEVRREIEAETDRETGKNKGVSSKAIRLKVFSPKVLNLTLVDLPGITKVPIGDQPSNIEHLIREMCLEYVSNPLSIILAVSPANADLANSDALKLAREVDPQGDRTIGILTKLDLVDEGVDVLDALSGKVIPLKRGYIGVVNRSQAQINAGLDIEEVRKKERAFFLNHPSYRPVADQHGTAYMTKKLNAILLHHIRENLPDIKASVQKQLRQIERELALLGTEAVGTDDRTAQGQMILSLLSKYANSFIDSMEGRQSPASRPSLAVEGGLYGGARLSRAFRSFSDRLNDISAFRELSDTDIGTAIMNATGPRPSLFVPELSFEVLVRRQLAHLQEPAQACVMDVYEIMQEVADQACFAGLGRFVTLKEHVLESVNRMLAESLKPTQGMIENLIKIEQAFINTSHPDFAQRLHMIRASTGGSLFASPSEPDPSTAAALTRSRMPHTGSSASVTSMTSEPARGPARGSLDLGTINDAMENVANAGNAAPRADSSDDEASNGGGSNANGAGNGKRSAFMSYIFDERVRGGSGAASAAAAANGGQHLPPSPLLQPAQAGGSSAAGGSVLPFAAFTHKSGLLPDRMLEENESDSQVRIIKGLIETYLGISKKNVLDLTPKTIMFFLVNHIKENLHTELIREMYKEEMFALLLREDEQVAQARANYKETATLLRRAMSILSEVREYKLK